MRGRQTSSAIGLGVIVLVAACANLSGLHGTSGDAGDASSHDASSHEGGNDSRAPHHGDSGGFDARKVGDAAPDAAPTAILYVDAQSGNDQNTGLTPAKPLRTLAAAVATSHPGFEIHACIGDYVQTATLIMSSDIILRGGYACGTYARPAVEGTPAPVVAVNTAGAPTLPSNATTIQGDVTPVVEFIGSGVTSATLLEAVTVAGATAVLQDTAIALEIEGASPRILHDVIVGGTGFVPGTLTATYDGAYGVHVIGDGANPELGWNYIHGGVASSMSGAGTRAVYINGETTNATQASIHDNSIDGGEGVSDSSVGSMGIQVINVSGPWAAPITHNQILGGHGSLSSGEYASSIGIVLFLVESGPPTSQPNAIDVTYNVITGGFASSPGGSSPMAGDFFTSSAFELLIVYGQVRVIGNRIDGGDVSGVSGIGAVSAVSTETRTTSSVLVASNLILAGNMENPPANYLVQPATLQGPATFVDNTVVAIDPTPAAIATAAGAVSILPQSGSTTVVENNLLVLGAGTALYGITLPTNNGPTSFGSNAFVNAEIVSCLGTCATFEAAPTGSTTQATIPAFESAVIAQPGGAATDDFRIVRVCDPSETVTSGRRSCLVDSACGDGGTNACIRDFAISPFSDPSGAPQFLSDAGWALAPSAACEILRGGTWLGDAGTPTDVNGATWTDKDAGFPSSGMTVGAVNDTRYCP